MKEELFFCVLKQNEKNIPIQLYHIENSIGEKRYDKKNLNISKKHQTSQYLFRFQFIKTF